MKKTRKWPSLLLMALAVLSFSACDDWGQMDPEPGRDVYPTTELVGEFLFDEEEGVLDPTLIQTFAYEGGDVPTLAQDELKGQVLYMPNGYARIFNPLKPVLGQNGAGLTFWMKQEIPAPEVDEEGNEIEAEPYVQDLTGALFSFQNEDATQRMYFTANGEIFYKGADGAFVENSASDAKTGYITPGEWHFVAINILEDGYLLYVDGLKKVEKSIPSFDCSKIVNFMRSAPYLYIGYGSDSQTAAWSIDELKIYQNELTSKEWKYKPLVDDTNDGGGEADYSFPPTGTVGYYKMDNNFDNTLNPSQSGQLITSEPQGTPSVFEENATRGTVWHQQEGWAGHANGWAYTEFANPLQGATAAEGVTIAMWINPPVLNWWDQIFVMNDGTSKFWFNAIGYLGYNGTGGWFDCQQNNADNALTAGEWTLVSIVVKPTGCEVYYNDQFKFSTESNAAYNSSGMTDFQCIVDLFKASSTWYLGYETFWKAAPALIDDVFFIERPLTATDVQILYANTNKVDGVVLTPAYLPSLKGYYPMNNDFSNALNPSQSGTLVTSEAQATPSAFEEDAVRGTVWHQQEGWAGHANGWAYTELANPLQGEAAPEGVSVSMWINPPVLNWWDQIFVLNDGTSKFWFNAIGYVGYNGTGGWFDCQQNNADNAMAAGEWTLVTISVTPAGFDVYYNGQLKFNLDSNAAFNSSGMTDFQSVVSLFTGSANWYLGYETFWKAAPALIDDVYFCAAPMSQKQAEALYNATKK